MRYKLFTLIIAVLLCTAACTNKVGNNELQSAFLQFGGYGSKYTNVLIDFKTGDYQKAITFSSKPLEIFLNESQKKEFLMFEESQIAQKKLDKNQLKSLQKEIKECKIEQFKTKYVNKDVLDGDTWHITLKYKDGTSKESYGIAAAPKELKQFKELMTKI